MKTQQIETLDQSKIDALIKSGDICECAGCGELSAYSFDYVTPKENDSYYRLCWQRGEIAHIGASSCWEWECGHCGANNVDVDAPILAECYTHYPIE